MFIANLGLTTEWTMWNLSKIAGAVPGEAGITLRSIPAYGLNRQNKMAKYFLSAGVTFIILAALSGGFFLVMLPQYSMAIFASYVMRVRMNWTKNKLVNIALFAAIQIIMFVFFDMGLRLVSGFGTSIMDFKRVWLDGIATYIAAFSIISCVSFWNKENSLDISSELRGESQAIAKIKKYIFLPLLIFVIGWTILWILLQGYLKLQCDSIFSYQEAGLISYANKKIAEGDSVSALAIINYLGDDDYLDSKKCDKPNFFVVLLGGIVSIVGDNNEMVTFEREQRQEKINSLKKRLHEAQ